jgi:hypothetical protein
MLQSARVFCAEDIHNLIKVYRHVAVYVNYLRATMGQPRLNSLMILHCHQDTADRLNLIEIAEEFVYASEKRSRFLEILHKYY